MTKGFFWSWVFGSLLLQRLRWPVVCVFLRQSCIAVYVQVPRQSRIAGYIVYSDSTSIVDCCVFSGSTSIVDCCVESVSLVIFSWTSLSQTMSFFLLIDGDELLANISHTAWLISCIGNPNLDSSFSIELIIAGKCSSQKLAEILPFTRHVDVQWYILRIYELTPKLILSFVSTCLCFLS